MLRSLFLTAIFLTFTVLGLGAPFVFTLGYAWVDTFRPQAVAMIILNQLPLALIMGMAAVGSYFAMDRRSPPRLTLASLLVVFMGIWVTMTLLWAESPDDAWTKWDWAFKTIAFSAFVPLAIRSRIQIEAFAQTYVLSLAANFIPFGMKTLINGGGYGRNLGLESGNSNLSEGGLLSTVCLMAVPLALHLAKHTQLLPRSRLVGLAYLGLSALALATAVGTFERSALIGIVVLGIYMFSRSRNKLAFGLVAAVLGAVFMYASSSAWTERIQTINDATQESSALTRLLVWKWTLNYASTHPFGGGFNSYVIDRIDFPSGETVYGRAFHSIYFEVLGEQGWVGLGIFLTLAGTTIVGLRRLARRARQIPELAWAADMSDALQSGLAVFLSSATFVGIAFQPAFWYFIAMSISLREYVRRVEQQRPAEGWRARAFQSDTMAPSLLPAPAAAANTPPATVPPWRSRRA